MAHAIFKVTNINQTTGEITGILIDNQGLVEQIGSTIQLNSTVVKAILTRATSLSIINEDGETEIKFKYRDNF